MQLSHFYHSGLGTRMPPNLFVVVDEPKGDQTSWRKLKEHGSQETTQLRLDTTDLA